MIHLRLFLHLVMVMSLVGGAVASADAANHTLYNKKLASGEITPFGATRAGNAAGTIPKWQCDQDGKYTVPPDIDVNPSDVHTHYYPAMKNPFVNEKPKFIITAKNYKRYKDKLTPGTIKLLTRYPNSFRMPVYPTHRTGCFSDWVYKQTKLNAKHAKLVDEGTGVVHAYGSVPFPLAHNGNEAAYNSTASAVTFYDDVYKPAFAIFASGQRVHTLTHLKTFIYYNDPVFGRKGYFNLGEKGATPRSGTLSIILKPERQRGTSNISVNYNRKKVHRIQAWGYQPGTRRVRRNPYYGFDTPEGAGNLHGLDDIRGFNGSLERFNWKLKGKKEIFVPYNAYGMDDLDLSYDDILGKHVINPKYTRWELHRVYVAQGTLKPGVRHWYEKRVLYLDEDSYHVLLADMYDHHDGLWRTTQNNYVWTPVIDKLYARGIVYYDLTAGAYDMEKLINELPKRWHPRLSYKQVPLSYWSPATLRRLSFR